MATNRLRGREKNVTSNSKGVKKRGSGLGTGPVGNTGGSMGVAVRLPVAKVHPAPVARKIIF